ncbi:MAG: 4-alpha-glucanotransferase [Lachnospiraceae bacterium]|nr:4-alpha-glucanotransferase [Lachnospiraceae bacterium]
MRKAGILLPIFSLPGKYGIGCLSKAAYDFVDFLARSGQSYWQILPIGPTGYGDSPYQTFCTFAGNPYFISLEELVSEGLLETSDLKKVDFGRDEEIIDYGQLYKVRFNVLKKAFKNSRHKGTDAYKAFEEENADWLSDYALFMALKDKYDGISFTKWPDELRFRDEKALKKAEKELAETMDFYGFLQYKFYEQWFKLKKYANEKGIGIIGDIPIYVSPDSSDLWANPKLFQTDENGELINVAGCPPDAFTPLGQLWGNPVYNWDHHKKTGYGWWITRMRRCIRLYDVVRIDHFRGFDEYYTIKAGKTDATEGVWMKGPGIELFKVMKKELGKMNIIAEDLGFITPSVRKLVKDTGFPNMKVLEFAFDPNDHKGKGEFLPHNYNSNSVVYTGTHDNETLVGYIKGTSPKVRKAVLSYLDLHTRDAKKIAAALVRLALSSVSELAVIPVQDYLMLDNRARINTPSTLGGNWVWRLKEEDLNADLSEKIKNLTDMFGRNTGEKKAK